MSEIPTRFPLATEPDTVQALEAETTDYLALAEELNLALKSEVFGVAHFAVMARKLMSDLVPASGCPTRDQLRRQARIYIRMLHQDIAHPELYWQADEPEKLDDNAHDDAVMQASRRLSSLAIYVESDFTRWRRHRYVEESVNCTEGLAGQRAHEEEVIALFGNTAAISYADTEQAA